MFSVTLASTNLPFASSLQLVEYDIELELLLAAGPDFLSFFVD